MIMAYLPIADGLISLLTKVGASYAGVFPSRWVPSADMGKTGSDAEIARLASKLDKPIIVRFSLNMCGDMGLS